MIINETNIINYVLNFKLFMQNVNNPLFFYISLIKTNNLLITDKLITDYFLFKKFNYG